MNLLLREIHALVVQLARIMQLIFPPAASQQSPPPSPHSSRPNRSLIDYYHYPRPSTNLLPRDFSAAAFPGQYTGICAPNALCYRTPSALSPACASLLGLGFCCTASDACHLDMSSQCATPGAAICDESAWARCPPSTTCAGGGSAQTRELVRCDAGAEVLDKLVAQIPPSATRTSVSSGVSSGSTSSSSESWVSVSPQMKVTSGPASSLPVSEISAASSLSSAAGITASAMSTSSGVNTMTAQAAVPTLTRSFGFTLSLTQSPTPGTSAKSSTGAAAILALAVLAVWHTRSRRAKRSTTRQRVARDLFDERRLAGLSEVYGSSAAAELSARNSTRELHGNGVLEKDGGFCHRQELHPKTPRVETGSSRRGTGRWELDGELEWVEKAF